MFPRRTFAIVGIANNDPFDPPIAIISRHLRDWSPFSRVEILHLVRLAVDLVDSADQTVLRNVLQVTTVFQPRSTSGDMIGRAFSFHLDQHGHILRVLFVPWLEWSKELKTVALRVNSDVYTGTILRWGLERILSGIITPRREFKSTRITEPELLSVLSLERILERVKRQISRECKCSDDIRGSDKGVRGWVRIITSGKVTVVRGDDRVLLPFFDVATIPLTDAWSTGVCEDESTDFFKYANLTITFNRCADLL